MFCGFSSVIYLALSYCQTFPTSSKIMINLGHVFTSVNPQMTTKHLFLFLYLLFYSLFFTESIYVNKSKGEFSNNERTDVLRRCPRRDKGCERSLPCPLQEGGVAGDPRVLQLCAYRHSPRQVPGLPCTAPAKDQAPPDVAVGETKKSPPHAAEKPPALIPAMGEQAKDL